MQSARRVAFGLLAAAAVASASDVHQLTKDTFNDFVKDNDLVLAEFYAPWCGHCKALAPEYEESATQLKEKNIKLAKVDCTEEAELCQSFGVEGYPTLKVFRGADNVSPYSGQRKAPAITSYMIKQSLPAVSPLTAENFEDFKNSDKVVVVAYIDASDSASTTAYTAIAEKLREEYLFGSTSDADLIASAGVKAPAVVLYKSFDEGKAIFTEKIEEEALTAWAKTASTPLIGEVGPDTYSGYMSAGLPLAYIFSEVEEERKELGDSLKSLAEKYKGKINFATIDAKLYGAHAGNLNLATDKFPSFALQDTVKNQKFPFAQDSALTVEAITKFVEDFVAGKIEPSVKSEPIPETQDSPVTVVVGKSYESVVLDDTKDVLIEFYAPWCGHCKALAPKYEELGALYANSEFKDKVVIAKVDATTNDVPDEIQGFPTIKLYAAGSKGEPVTYSGSRTVEDLIEFIAKNGKYQASVSPAVEADEPETPVAPAATEAKEAEATEAHDEL